MINKIESPTEINSNRGRVPIRVDVPVMDHANKRVRSA